MNTSFEKEKHLHPLPRLVDERTLEFSADLVVLHDEEVHANVIPRGGDLREKPVKGFVPVDQQLQFVASREGQAPQFPGGALEHILLRQLHCVTLQTLMHIRRQLPQLHVVSAPRPHIAGKLAPPQQPVERDREKRQSDQRNHPRNRTLRCARVHQRMEDMRDAENIERCQSPQPKPRRGLNVISEHGTRIGAFMARTRSKRSGAISPARIRQRAMAAAR